MRATAWLLYWLGDGASKLLALVPDEDRWEPLQEALYTVYNRLMLASLRLQGDGEGPWK